MVLITAYCIKCKSNSPHEKIEENLICTLCGEPGSKGCPFNVNQMNILNNLKGKLKSNGK